jgi:hypothetical protein
MNSPAASFQTIGQMAGPLRALPLPAVLRMLNARPDRRDPRKWHTSQGTLSVNGPKFINWTCGRGGGGAIDLVMHLNGCHFKEALQWLARHFPLPPAPEPPRAAPALKLPPPAPGRLWRVRRYLALQRGLAPNLIDSLIHSALLYADHRANAVFVLRANSGQAVGAELRGTSACSWRGMAPGSQKDLGFFSVAGSPVRGIILCESAIDAMSCLALHPGHHCISTAGARSSPPWLSSLLEQSLPVFCGFDADPTGEHMAQAMIHRYPAIQRLRPPRHDWNEVLRASR